MIEFILSSGDQENTGMNKPTYEQLQAQVKQLAAENAAMKSNAIKASSVIMCSKFDYWSDRVELFEAVRLITETPATDAILASLRAEGVEMFALMYAEEAIKDGSDNTDWKSRASSAASEYAAQLRSK